MTDYRDIHVMQVFGFGKEAAFLGIGVVDPFVGRNGAGKLKPVDFVLFVARRHHGDGPARFYPRRNLYSHSLSRRGTHPEWPWCLHRSAACGCVLPP